MHTINGDFVEVPRYVEYELSIYSWKYFTSDLFESDCRIEKTSILCHL